MNIKKKNRNLGELSTASLPDIVFMLLFFFMVTTVMRDEEPAIQIDKPTAMNVDEIEQKDLSAVLWIGYRSEDPIPSIHLDGQLIQASDLGRMVEEKRAQLPERLAPKFTVILKADKHLNMEMITDVKQRLREVNALKIQYSTEIADFPA